MKRQTTIIILAVAMTMVVSGCALRNQKTNSKNQNKVKSAVVNNQIRNQSQQEQVATSTVSEKVATSSEELAMSNWKTYRNDEYGFELKYPGSINITKFSSGPNTAGLIVDFGDITLFVTSKKDAQKIDDNSDSILPYYFIESPLTIKRALDRWEYGKLIYEKKKDITSNEKFPWFCSNMNDLICFDYYREGDLFTKKDITYNGNNRYEFSIILPSGLNWDDINKLNNPEMKRNEIYKQIQNVSINYLNNIYNKEDAEKNSIMEEIKRSMLFR